MWHLAVETSGVIADLAMGLAAAHVPSQAGRLLELMGNYIETVSDLRRRAVASAVTLPGMSMGKVADELGIPKSTVAKMAGPASIRQQIASDMRGHLVASGDSPSSDERLRAAFGFGAREGQRR